MCPWWCDPTAGSEEFCFSETLRFFARFPYTNRPAAILGEWELGRPFLTRLITARTHPNRQAAEFHTTETQRYPLWLYRAGL